MSNFEELNRRDFLGRAVFYFAFSIGLGSIIASCGKESNSYSSNNQPQTRSGGNCTLNGPDISIQVQHSPNHTLSIPVIDIAAGVQKTYTLEDNGAGHTHQITLTAADFASLQKNNGIAEFSTQASGHTHSVIVNCA